MPDLQKTRELARWLVEYEFTNPEARYKSHFELIDFYTIKLNELVGQARSEAITALLEAMPEYQDYDAAKELRKGTYTRGAEAEVQGFNKAVYQVTAIIERQLGQK